MPVPVPIAVAIPGERGSFGRSRVDARGLEEHRGSDGAKRLGHPRQWRGDGDDVPVLLLRPGELRHLGEHREPERGLGVGPGPDPVVEAIQHQRQRHAGQKAQERTEETRDTGSSRVVEELLTLMAPLPSGDTLHA